MMLCYMRFSSGRTEKPRHPFGMVFQGKIQYPGGIIGFLYQNPAAAETG